MICNIFNWRRKREQRPSGESDAGYLRLREGGYDPELNKWIRKLIFVEEKLAVYVDTDYDVQWLMDADVNMSEFGKVQTEVTYLELESSFLRRDRSALLHVRSLLGDA